MAYSKSAKPSPKLLEMARKSFPKTGGTPIDIMAEFGEQIVRECAKIADNGSEFSGEAVARAIRQRFNLKDGE